LLGLEKGVVDPLLDEELDEERDDEPAEGAGELNERDGLDLLLEGAGEEKERDGELGALDRGAEKDRLPELNPDLLPLENDLPPAARAGATVITSARTTVTTRATMRRIQAPGRMTPHPATILASREIPPWCEEFLQPFGWIDYATRAKGSRWLGRTMRKGGASAP
jgi:hypothetical protein